jgi:hypothetical protein
MHGKAEQSQALRSWPSGQTTGNGLIFGTVPYAIECQALPKTNASMNEPSAIDEKSIEPSVSKLDDETQETDDYPSPSNLVFMIIALVLSMFLVRNALYAYGEGV